MGFQAHLTVRYSQLAPTLPSVLNDIVFPTLMGLNLRRLGMLHSVEPMTSD